LSGEFAGQEFMIYPFQMSKWLIFLALIFSPLISCQKKISLRQASPSDREIISRYLALPRPPVSASFSAVSGRGYLKGELYLESGAAPLALVYGYSQIGQSLFELKLRGTTFLFLDFADSHAYSNDKDWLKDYAVEDELPAEDEIFLFLTRALFSLTGDIQEPESVYRSGENELVAVAHPSPDQTISYYFDPVLPQLEKMTIRKSGLNLKLEFEYGYPCWLPSRINLKNHPLRASIKMETINCAERQRPKFNIAIPAGFRQVLVSGR